MDNRICFREPPKLLTGARKGLRKFISSLTALIYVTTSAPIAAATMEESGNSERYDPTAGYDVYPGQYKVSLTKSRQVRMRDGTLLSTDLYIPEGLTGRAPIVLIRTPYGKNSYRIPPRADRPEVENGRVASLPYFFAARGYVVAIQDHRGRGESQGEFFAWDRQDGIDGYDTVEWLSKQPWSNGRVGTIGCSYVGETQHKLASQRHPAHVAAVAQSGSSSFGEGGVWNLGFTRYGVMELAAALDWAHMMGNTFPYGPPPGVDREEWFSSDVAGRFETGVTGERHESPAKMAAAFQTLPLIDAMKNLGPARSEFENWVRFAGDFDNPYWQRTGMIANDFRFNVPTLHINSWLDFTPNSTITLHRIFRENAESERAADNQYLIMAPTSHCQFEQATRDTMIFGRSMGDARLNWAGLYLAWFDKMVRNDAPAFDPSFPKVLSYEMGANRWVGSPVWPLAGVTEQRWYLSSTRGANSSNGDGRLSLDAAPSAANADTFVYDPMLPTPTRGGVTATHAPGSAPLDGDQREIEIRNDTLVYTSDPLETGLEVAGRIKAHLFVSSTARDTDFVVKLTDVYPDGRSFQLQEGVIRARLRDLHRPQLMKPGVVYPIVVDVESTHNYFAPGHRIRIDITSSSFPRFDRNLNTGGNNFDESKAVTARNTIHLSPRHRSYISLETRGAR